MKITHLQLNTSLLNSPDKIMEFVKGDRWGENGLTLGCLQEVVYPLEQENPLQRLLENEGYYYVEGVHFKYLPKSEVSAVGIFSQWPIVDYVKLYYNTDTLSPKEVTGEEFASHNLMGEKRRKDFPGSRGLANSIKSRCILAAVINSPEGLIRLITTHFTVSDLCTETVQMYEMAKMVSSLVGQSKPMPTIFSADLNLRPQSYSVEKMSEVLTCHTKDLQNTLADNHIAVTGGDFPDGLAVDHIFSRELKHIKTEDIQVDFSVHKALVSEFSS